MLLTLMGAVAVSGVVEAPVGSSLRSLVMASGGLTVARPSAILVGGYAGAWLEPSTSWDLPFSAAGLRPAGAEPGVGLVAVLPERTCPVSETARLAAWLSGEGAQQCGPCFNGLPAIARAAATLARGGAEAAPTPALLARWAGMVEGRGACHHPDGVVRLVRSLLAAFPDEVARHAAARGCSFGSDPFLPLPSHGGDEWR
jgi:NADH:ubiquinone oxidoreductase subunit F (NADH-binding)